MIWLTYYRRSSCMASVVLKNIYKKYPGGVTAVNDFNLNIADKEFVVLVGPSGCGKSTTLRMIAGLEEITSGELLIDGKLVNDIAPKDRDIAMVFQNYALYPHMTVFENMAFGLKLRKTPKGEIKKRVTEAARILEIEHLLDRSIKALSGGQRQRVALGRAIVREPKVFLMDEPLSNLDAKLRAQMRTEIIKLHQKLQTTIIYVTHDQTEAMTMGSRIVVMKDGYIQQVDSPQVLYEKPCNMFVAGFMGSPQMNFVNCRVEKENGDVRLRIGRWTIKMPEAKGKVLEELGYLDKEVVMGVRSEHVHDEAMYLETYKDSQVELPIDVVELLGSESLLYMMLEGSLFIARVKPRSNVYVGDVMRFAIDPNKVHIFDKETENTVIN